MAFDFGSEILLYSSVLYHHHILILAVTSPQLLQIVIISFLPLLRRVLQPLYVIMELVVLPGGDLDGDHLADESVVGVLLLLLELELLHPVPVLVSVPQVLLEHLI